MGKGLKVFGDLKKIARMLVIIMSLLLVLPIVFANPPTPHNVKGFVFNELGVGMPNGIPVKINNTITGDVTLTEVYAPPIPALAGTYSGTIDGSNGNIIHVYAWNDTHYGFSIGSLSSTTELNVSMNQSRAPEPNVTIISPTDNISRNVTEEFNITANITVLFANGVCNASIFFGNASILNVSTGNNLINELGSISEGSSVLTYFNVTGQDLGSTSVRVETTCSPQGPIFAAETSDSLSNITINDNQIPQVNLEAPPNNTSNTTSFTLSFTYNVSDHSTIQSCELIIDGTSVDTNTSIVRDITQSFTSTLSNGQHNWSINCTDKQGFEGQSEERNITIEVNAPQVSITNLTQNIVLNAGSIKEVFCNVSVMDGNGAADIVGVNATFYSAMNASGDADHPRSHYTNQTCEEVSSGATEKNYTCGFSIQYYARNGTWECNATALDQSDLTGTDTLNTSIDPLFAINITPTLIDYGDLGAGQISEDQEINISNMGNVPINISVTSYGADYGDNLSFVCTGNNISATDTHFSQALGIDYFSKTALEMLLIDMGLSISSQTEPGILQEASSYFQLRIPALIPAIEFGTCSGTLVFEAGAST